MRHNPKQIARLAALPLLLLAACQGDDLTAPSPTGQGTSVLTFSVDAATADTRAFSPEAGDNDDQSLSAQHVQNVKLHIFRGSGADAVYVGLDGNTPSSWANLTTVEGGQLVGTGQETTSKRYPVQTALEPNTTYTLLGVAYEDEDIYDLILPTDDDTQAEPGTRLTEGGEADLSRLSSVLKSGKDKSYIQQNEYFTGTATVSTDADGRLPEDTRVVMRRRVAGLSAHFRLENFPEQPAAVAIMLWRKQHKDVPTLKKIWQEPFFTDHGTQFLPEAEANAQPKDLPECLLWIDNLQQEPATKSLRSEGEPDPGPGTDPNPDPDEPEPGPDPDPEGGGDGPTPGGGNDPGAGGTPTETYTYNGKSSAYVLPQESATYAANGETGAYNADGSIYALPQPAPDHDSEKNYTLAVVVYNKDYKVICTKRAALAKDGQLIFATDLGTGIVDDESFYRYPIVANRFYRFGKAGEEMPVTFDPNNPFEVIVEEGWEGMPDLDFDK